MIASAERDFFAFRLEAKEPDFWVFTGKPQADLAERTFLQEARPLSAGNDFLLGSCSFPSGSPGQSVCESILSTWKAVKSEKQ